MSNDLDEQMFETRPAVLATDGSVMQFPAEFTRHEIHRLPTLEQVSAANALDLPYFEAFFGSVGNCQACEPGRLIRRYLSDLLSQGYFVIRSPVTGQELKSGASLLLVDKSVLFSFPEEPEVMLGIGDISLGYPMCALLLTRQALFLPLTDSLWGFAERHLSLAAEAIRDTGWVVAPSSGPLTLVVGDTNFAHYAWNQLSALHDIADHSVRDDIRIVATQQPLGPIREILPELPAWPLTVVPDTALQAENRLGMVFVPVGAHLLQTTLCARISSFALDRMSGAAKEIDAALASTAGPVLWMSIRTRNRTALNQREMLEALGGCFLSTVPGSAVVIDGYSLADDLSSYPEYHRNEAAEVLAADQQAGQSLHEVLSRRDPGRVHLAVGLSVSDSIGLARRASLYFCHHGTVQHKVGWFAAVPGVVHCNRGMLMAGPAQWVAAQSEVALLPTYLSPDLIQDEEAPTTAEFARLLRHENYTILDIPAVVAIVLAQAEAAGLLASAHLEQTPKRMAFVPKYLARVASLCRFPRAPI